LSFLQQFQQCHQHFEQLASFRFNLLEVYSRLEGETPPRADPREEFSSPGGTDARRRKEEMIFFALFPPSFHPQRPTPRLVRSQRPKSFGAGTDRHVLRGTVDTDEEEDPRLRFEHAESLPGRRPRRSLPFSRGPDGDRRRSTSRLFFSNWSRSSTIARRKATYSSRRRPR
jgi:hypothetical protein